MIDKLQRRLDNIADAFAYFAFRCQAVADITALLWVEALCDVTGWVF